MGTGCAQVYREDLKSVKILRLVSKTMNELAETRAFASITINFERSSYIEHQLSTLASGNSPATRWAKRLIILNLEPVGLDILSLHEELQEEASETMLACQNKYLIPAIQALRNVEFASYVHLILWPYNYQSS
jgi:kynurenine formamidase